MTHRTCVTGICAKEGKYAGVTAGTGTDRALTLAGKGIQQTLQKPPA
ncbi:hypothetical protein JOC37_000752 [Desulfohalotomaculum tongense]|nr:hypothetical protein [Desulforadius tongensis]MBM7854379.1 hypothetical protein [Desulforadius tongensis]